CLDPELAESLDRLLQSPGVRRRPGEVQVAALAELALDRLVDDEPLQERVGVQCLLEERPAGLIAIALDELRRAPFVARMDDPTVPGRAAETELLGLEERDL